MSTKTHVTTKPEYLRLLVAACGDNCAEAARRMGVASSLVSGDLREDQTRMVNDLAAKSILSDMTAESRSVGPDSVRDAVKVVAEYFSKTPALAVPPDLIALLGKKFVDVVTEASK